MGLIAVVAGKGAPGVSTTAVAVALSWPRPMLLAECDPAGSDLPWWLPTESGGPLSTARGVMSLAAAVRGGPAAGSPRALDHAQVLDGGLPVLVGPAGPDQATAIGAAWGGIAQSLINAGQENGGPAGDGTPGDQAGVGGAGGGVDVVADCGRLVSTSSPAAPVLRHADMVVLLTRPTAAGVAHLRRGITVTAQLLNTAGRRTGSSRIVVLVVDDDAAGGGGRARLLRSGGGGAGGGGARQVAEVLADTAGLDDVPVVGVLAWDPKAAAALAGRGWGSSLRRSALLRSSTSVAAVLAGRLDEMAAAQTPGPDGRWDEPAAAEHGAGATRAAWSMKLSEGAGR